MTIRNLVAATGAALLLSLQLPASAGVLLQDNFDTDASTSALNFNGLANWTVSGGTIDYIRDGDFGIRCFGNAGGCLDSDGSTGAAGRIDSRISFTLSPVLLYTLELQVSGNQRGGPADGIAYGLTDVSTSIDVTLTSFPQGSFQPSDPYQLKSTSFSGLSLDYSHQFRVWVAGLGADNIGAVIDNVRFSDDSQRAVPAPGTAALAGLALLGLAAARRRVRR